MRHWLITVIAVVTVVRLVVAAVTPLAPDEAYYWVWSHALAPGYLDHPPMVAIWIAAGTALLGKTALGVRLLGPVSAALASWMLYDTGRRLFPASNAGPAAVMLLNASLLLGVGSVIMTPDTPLLFFWTATLWAAARIAPGGAARIAPGGAARIATGGAAMWWLLAGLFGGLALDSKYTGLFLWIGIGLWIVLVPTLRPWLLRWQPYAAIAIGLLVFAPVVAWNAQHHWAGFLKQGGRVADWQPMRALGWQAELIGGQIGLATPLVWWLCMLGLLHAINKAFRQRDPAWTLLAALSLPPVVVFLQHALGDRVQGNWPAIIYPALAIAAGGLFRDRAWFAASALGFAITLLVYAQTAFGVFPLPPTLDPIALRLAGWTSLAQQIDADATANGTNFITAEGYAPLSELAWCIPSGIATVGTDERWRLTNLPTALIGGKVGLLLQDSRRIDPPDSAIWTSARLLQVAVRPGSGTSGFAVYRVTAAPGLKATILPP